MGYKYSLQTTNIACNINCKETISSIFKMIRNKIDKMLGRNRQPDNNSSSSSQPRAKSELHQQQEILLHDETIIKRVPITNHYEKIEYDAVLGSGVNGQVVKLRNKMTNKIVAMKQIASNQKSAREVTLHYIAQQNCEYITAIDGIYLNRNGGRDYFYCFMECMNGGELFDYIAKRDQERHLRLQQGDNTQTSIFNEREVATMIRMIAKALNHLHKDLGIAHRDLKPENILLTEDFVPGKSGCIKLTDFGFAKEARSLNNTKALATACYTPYYVAPEVFGNERYDFACDIWSLGVILYILLVGYPPFYSFSGQNTLTPSMKRNIREANFDTDTKEFQNISKDAVDLIHKMLKAKPAERITIEQVMNHPWIKEGIETIPENQVQFGENARHYFSNEGRAEVNQAMTESLASERPKEAEHIVLPAVANLRGGARGRNRRRRPHDNHETRSPANKVVKQHSNMSVQE